MYEMGVPGVCLLGTQIGGMYHGVCTIGIIYQFEIYEEKCMPLELQENEDS